MRYIIVQFIRVSYEQIFCALISSKDRLIIQYNKSASFKSGWRRLVCQGFLGLGIVESLGFRWNQRVQWGSWGICRFQKEWNVVLNIKQKKSSWILFMGDHKIVGSQEPCQFSEINVIFAGALSPYGPGLVGVAIDTFECLQLVSTRHVSVRQVEA